jgi:hypothetical protein
VTKDIALAVFPGLKLTVRIPAVYRDSADPQNGMDIYNGNFILPVRSRVSRLGSNDQTITVNLDVDWGDGTAPVTLNTVPVTNQDADYTHYYTDALAGAEVKDFVIRIKGTCTSDGTFSEIFGKFGMGYWSAGNADGVNNSVISGFLRWGHKNKIVKAAGNISALTEGSAVTTYAYQSAFFDCRGLEDISGLVFTDSGDQGHSFLQGAFKECTALSTIPAGLLPRGLTNTRQFLYQTFQGSGIETIPSGFLPEFTAVDAGFLASAFGGVNSGDGVAISAIPPDFIPASLTTVGNSFLQNTFENCVNLTSIPDGFAANITSVGDSFLDSTFTLTGLSAIPANFVPQNPSAIGEYFLSSTFSNTGITTVPTNFIPESYKTIPATHVLNGTFQSVTSLTSVDLEFLKNINAADYYAFTNLFYGCTNLTEVRLPYFYINPDYEGLFAAAFTNTGSDFVLHINGGGDSGPRVLEVYQTAGLDNTKVSAVYLDSEALVTAYRDSSFWFAIDDNKFQVKPQE